MSSNEIEKFFKEVPNTAALPVTEKELQPVTYDEAIVVVENILKKDPELYKQYKSGNIYNNKIDNGVDILSLIISCYVNALRNKKNSFLIITHYQRLLNYIKPDFVHVLINGKIVKSGGKSIAEEIELSGYKKFG